jgi:hypothetical protein
MEKKPASLSLHKVTLKTLKLRSSVKTGMFQLPTRSCPTVVCTRDGRSDCLLDPNL